MTILLITKVITAICRGRIETLVTVRRSRNRHMETLVNVSVAKVFSKSVSESRVLENQMSYLEPLSIHVL